MRYLLDTHTWIWWYLSPEKLSKKAIATISNSKCYEGLLLSAISIWELCKLVEKGRLAISYDTEELIKKALEMPGLTLVPLTPAIALKSTTLPQPLHNDPADQIIVATAREENATLITADKRLIDYKHIKTLW